MLTTSTYHRVCKVPYYSEFLTQPQFLFKGLHLQFLTACAISVSSNTNWALQDAGQSVSDKSNFYQLLWFSLEPSSGSGHWLSYITVVHVKEIQWLAFKTILQGRFSPVYFTLLLHLWSTDRVTVPGLVQLHMFLSLLTQRTETCSWNKMLTKVQPCPYSSLCNGLERKKMFWVQ